MIILLLAALAVLAMIGGGFKLVADATSVRAAGGVLLMVLGLVLLVPALASVSL